MSKFLLQINKASFVDENFSVNVSKAANEVVATYKKDETGVDLVIRLPASYPLRPVDVDCTRSLGISELKQRKWLMSMMLFLSNQVICSFQIIHVVTSIWLPFEVQKTLSLLYQVICVFEAIEKKKLNSLHKCGQ